MSLLQIDDALCHWLAGHNVTLDFLENEEAWPARIACAASLLPSSIPSSIVSAGYGSPEDEKRRRDFVNRVCASAREWRKTRPGEQFPWTHILAGLLEETVPEAIT